MKKVLIFPAGTEIALEIFNALKFSKFVEIYGGTSKLDHSESVYKHLISDFPYVTEPGFIKFLNEIIDREKIDCIFPAHDSVCMFLSRFSTEIHAQVIVCDYSTVKICRSKAETYSFFQGEDFIPEVYKSMKDIKKYPIFVKPKVGQGAEGAKKINFENELENAIRNDDTLIMCEYLPGMEYTVDCFTDRYGKLRVVKLRTRERIRTGISVRSKVIKTDKKIKDIANIINQKLKFRGVWFFQVKKSIDGNYKLMEISPRIPGTIGLTRNLGINFAMLTLFDFWGYDVDIIDNGYNIMVDRAFYSVYQISCDYEYVYIDYDDTLVIQNRVNEDLIKFIYQARNNKKQIYLLSRHRGDIYYELRKNGISEYLFQQINIVPENEEKYQYIKSKKAIFIDDSYRERKKIYEKCGIPVFDLDMIESLIEWRI